MITFKVEPKEKSLAVIDILPDKEVSASASQDTISQETMRDPMTVLPAQKARPRVRLVYAIRSALGTGIILAWALLSPHPTLSAWIDSQIAPAQVSQQTPSTMGMFSYVLSAARVYCPPQAHVLMLNTNFAADSLTEYYVYPRRVDSIELTDPFSATDLDAHVGGCLIYYGSQAGQRLDPFKSRLSEIVCSGKGCLYGIER